MLNLLTKMNTPYKQAPEPNANEFQTLVAPITEPSSSKHHKTGKKAFDKKMKWSPSLKDEGNFTQVSNHLILNPILSAEEKELILVYLMHKNGFLLTIESFCEDLHLKPRQVLIRLNSLKDKGIFELDDKYWKLIIPKIDNPMHNLRAKKLVIDDTESCVITQGLPGKDALDDTKMCVTTQGLLELSIEQQGIAGSEKTNSKTGADERTYTNGARTSENMVEDSVNDNLEISSSVGRNPMVVAPTECSIVESNDFLNTLESCSISTKKTVKTPEGGAPTEIPMEKNGNFLVKAESELEIPLLYPNNFFNDWETALTPTETIRRSPSDNAPFVSEFWTDEDTTNLNYRWYKIELDINSNFKYTFAQFEEIVALALFFYLYKNDIEIPTNNSSFQKFAKHIGIRYEDASHINNEDYLCGVGLYESKEPDAKAFREDIFTIWKIKLPAVYNVQLPVEPFTSQLPSTPVTIKPVVDFKERVRKICKEIRKKNELQYQP